MDSADRSRQQAGQVVSPRQEPWPTVSYRFHVGLAQPEERNLLPVLVYRNGICGNRIDDASSVRIVDDVDRICLGLWCGARNRRGQHKKKTGKRDILR